MSIFSLGVAGMNSAHPAPRRARTSSTAAIAIENVYGSTTNVAGPALGGVLIAVARPQGRVPARRGHLRRLALVGLAAAGAARRPTTPSGRACARSPRASASSRGKKVLLGMFLVDSNAMVFGMPRALFPALALNRFDGGAGVARPDVRRAVCRRARGLARLRLDRARAPAGPGRRIAAALWGVAIAAFGFAETLWLALLLLAAAGAADNVSAVLRGTILWTVTPDPLRGRVSGIEFAQVAATPALGNVEAGARRLADERALLDRLRRDPLRRRYLRDRPCRPRLHPLRRARCPARGFFARSVHEVAPDADRRDAARRRRRRADRRGRGLRPRGPGEPRLPRPHRRGTPRCSARPGTPTSTARTGSTGA